MNFHLLISIIFYCVIITPGAISDEVKETKSKYIITIGGSSIVDATATLRADGGDIHIGAGGVIEGGVTIINKKSEDGRRHDMIVGDSNAFRAGSTSYALRIGNSNTFERNSYLGHEVTIGSGCVVEAGCRLHAGQISDSTRVSCTTKDGRVVFSRI